MQRLSITANVQYSNKNNIHINLNITRNGASKKEKAMVGIKVFRDVAGPLFTCLFSCGCSFCLCSSLCILYIFRFCGGFA